jgi:hypothetical protein
VYTELASQWRELADQIDGNKRDPPPRLAQRQDAQSK